MPCHLVLQRIAIVVVMPEFQVSQVLANKTVYALGQCLSSTTIPGGLVLLIHQEHREFLQWRYNNTHTRYSDVTNNAHAPYINTHCNLSHKQGGRGVP